MDKILKLIITSTFILIITGCTKQPTYNEQLNTRPLPTTQQDKQEECNYIRQEIARMQSLYQVASTQRCNPSLGICLGPAMMAKSNRNRASLESRAAQVQCDAAFSTVKIINNGTNNSSIKECISACKENTDRSSSECFDVCNK